MQKLFNKILVPVDFSANSESAIEKAVEIARLYHCSIHLLHVVTTSLSKTFAMADDQIAIPYDIIENRHELELKMEKLCNNIHSGSGDSIEVAYSVLKGSWDETIIDLVNQIKFDLVLIGQKAKFAGIRNMRINPDILAEKTNIPVITAPSNKRLTKLYSIVIPITDFLPVRKLMYGVYIAANNDTTLKLLGVENEKTKDKVRLYMEIAYQLIRNNCSVEIDLQFVEGKNVADAVNQFTMRQSVDLIILNPGSQTKMPGFFSALLGNIIQKYSLPPVLTVSPV
jgi:nucleotide-binding universal stress UspA family protein